MRRKFIGGNWKMNGSHEEASVLANGIVAGLANFDKADVVVFPSFVYLQQVKGLLVHSKIGLGGQNMCQFDKGAYTGEISGPMLADIGCRYVLLGHSERRQIFGESSELVAEKFAAALNHQLTPVLCVGETQQEREANETEEVVLEQLNAVIGVVGIEALAKSVIAYEPVWAIGTGLTATPEQAQEVHAFIRETMALQNKTVANETRIIYGGSVKPDNAAEIFEKPDVDGGLIGGASLKINDFIAIARS